MTPLERLRYKQRMGDDMSRILALPEYTPGTEVSELLELPGGEKKLFPLQAIALDHIMYAGGLLGFLGVGMGKTLIAALAGTVLDLAPEEVLLCLPPTLEAEFYRQLEEYRPHFAVTEPRTLRYSMLSRPTGVSYLFDLKPKLIILDEAHQVANRDSARGRRLLRYLIQYPETHLVCLSGTLIRKSIADIANFSKYALGDLSPLPLTWTRTEGWAALLDQSKGGRLPEQADFEAFQPLCRWYESRTGNASASRGFRDSQTHARKAFQYRLRTAAGCVLSQRTSCDASIYYRLQRDPKPDAPTKEAIDNLEKYWELPDGTELVHALEMDRARRQLSLGFFYRWEWADGVDVEWLELRSAWASELGRFRKRPGALFDSPATIIAAIQAGHIRSEHWAAWDAVAGRSKPSTVAVWVSEFFFDALPKDLDPTTLLWYNHRAVADKLQERGYEVVRPGKEVPRRKETRPLCLSIKSHGTGQNLQAWDTNIILSPPSSADDWEQLIGRTHREGQEADAVRVCAYVHTKYNKRSWDNAREGARTRWEQTGQQQKILLATEEREEA